MTLAELQQKNKELQILNNIAYQLNQEVSLHKALQSTLEQAVNLMEMRSGWIWLIDPRSNTVYLAATYQLPPAFTQHPERLSGWCYCIDKYLANNLDNATNISEITCSRLKDLEEGTEGLRFHASIPLFNQKQKMGILNIVSETSQQLSDNQLALLNTIGSLLSSTISRTKQYDQSKEIGALEAEKRVFQQMSKQGLVTLNNVQLLLNNMQTVMHPSTKAEQLKDLQEFINHNIQHYQQNLTNTSKSSVNRSSSPAPLQYPYTPLSKRELEVLHLIQAGKTNKAIGTTLFISERTVKFHVSTILSKLQVANRTEAVQIALKMGIIQV